jgi:hypothetical protein
MTVYELCNSFVESENQMINIWAHNTESVIWEGTAAEICYTEYADMEVSSIDNLENYSDILTVNILDDITDDAE